MSQRRHCGVSNAVGTARFHMGMYGFQRTGRSSSTTVPKKNGTVCHNSGRYVSGEWHMVRGIAALPGLERAATIVRVYTSQPNSEQEKSEKCSDKRWRKKAQNNTWTDHVPRICLRP